MLTGSPEYVARMGKITKCFCEFCAVQGTRGLETIPEMDKELNYLYGVEH
jgi:hypothetical protein